MIIIFDIVGLKDKGRVCVLLESGGLRSEYVLEKGTRYWGAVSDGELIGVIGCEYQGKYALLRSAFVETNYRGQGVAARLTEKVIDTAQKGDIESIYLFSTDAGEYWVRRGFREVPVAEVTEKLSGCPQVRLFEELGWLPTEVAYKYDIV